MVGKLVGLIVSAIVSAILSVASKVIKASISKANQPKTKSQTRRVSSQSRERKQNATDTIAFIPLVFGRARVGGPTVFRATRQAYSRTEKVFDQGVKVEVEKEGNFLYTKTIHSFGPIREIEEVYLDGQPVDAPKFNGQYVNNNVTFSWVYTEPDSVTDGLPVKVLTPLTGNNSKLSTHNNQQVVRDANSTALVSTNTPLRYFLQRRAAGATVWVTVKEFAGGTNFFISDFNYGSWEFLLLYGKDDGTRVNVGNATVTFTLDNADFVQSVDNNLTITQNSFLSSQYVQLTERTGFSNTAANLWLEEAVPGYNAQMTGTGLAWSGIRLLKHTKGESVEKNPLENIPEITADIQGVVMYDPRKDSTNVAAGGSGSHREDNINTWEYTTNPALAIRYLFRLSKENGGFGLSTADLLDDWFAESANVCDETVTYNGETFKKYEVNGVADLGDRPVDILNDLLNSCNAIVVEDKGKIGIRVLKPENSSYSFTTDNITGDISYNKGSIRDKTNTLNVKYISEALSWETDIITITNDAFKEQDKGRLYESELDLNFADNYNQAYYLGVQKLKQSRLQGRASISSFWSAYQLLAGDVVDLTHPALNWNQKLFRVESISINDQGKLDLDLIEYDEDVYTVDNIDPKADDLTTNLNLPFDVQPPSALQVLQNFALDQNGDHIGDIVNLSWTSSTSPDIVEYDIDFKPQTATEWQKLGLSRTTSISSDAFLIGPYSARVRARNRIGGVSDYLEGDFQVYDILDEPPDVERFVLQTSNNEIALNWEKVPQVAVTGFYRIKHIPKTSGASWFDAPTFDLRVPGYQTSITLSQIDGTYLIKAENTAGLQSANAASKILDLPEDADWQLVQTLTESPNFAGAKTNLVVVDGELTLDSNTLWDDLSGTMDDLSSALIDSIGNKLMFGTYTFANDVDLGGVYRAKLRKTATANFLEVDNNMDDLTVELIDQWGRAFWDGSSPVNAEINLSFRASRNGISFSPYELLTVNEATGRYFEFGADFIASSIDEDIKLSTLQTHIYLKQRLEQGSSTSSASADVTKSFDFAFYATPVVTLVINNPVSGDYVALSNITTSGFDFSVYDSSDTRVARDVTYLAQGLGQKLA